VRFRAPESCRAARIPIRKLVALSPPRDAAEPRPFGSGLSAMRSTAGSRHHAAVPLLVLLAGCSGGDAEEPAGRAPDRNASATRYRFVDATAASGLDVFRQVSGHPEKHYIIEGVGAGCALFDYDRDGDLDAYLTNGSRLEGFPAGEAPRDMLFANDGAGRFTDVTAAAGLGDTSWTFGVTVADVDADGWPDLYLSNWGPNVLLRNQGDGTFRDVTAESGLGDPRWGACASFFDYDHDEDLDVYLTNYIAFDAEEMIAQRPTEDYQGITVYRGPRGLPPERDAFYRNDGGKFVDVSSEAGIDAPAMFGFQSVVFDHDLDGWLDVFVANDSQANFLWRNDGKGGFEDIALVTGSAVNMFGKEQSGMGVAVGDVDGDLRVDLYVTHFSHDYSTLYRGVPPNAYVDATYRLKLVEDTQVDIAWGCGFEDFDSDGDLEIFAVNGHIYPQVDRVAAGLSYAQSNDLFELEGGTWRLPPGGAGPGFDVKKVSRGAAVGDVDGDGDLDLLIENLDDVPTLLVNEGPQGHWLRLALRQPGANAGAIGARVGVRAGERRHLRLAGSGGSFLSWSDTVLHVGLGTATRADEVVVTWPDGFVEAFGPFDADRTVELTKGAGAPAD